MRKKIKIKNLKISYDTSKKLSRIYTRFCKRRNKTPQFKSIGGLQWRDHILASSPETIIHELIHYYNEEYLYKDLWSKYRECTTYFIDKRIEINCKRFKGEYLEYRNRFTEILAWYCEYVLLASLAYAKTKKQFIKYLKEIKELSQTTKNFDLENEFCYNFIRLLAKYKFFSTLFKIYKELEIIKNE